MAANYCIIVGVLSIRKRYQLSMVLSEESCCAIQEVGDLHVREEFVKPREIGERLSLARGELS